MKHHHAHGRRTGHSRRLAMTLALTSGYMIAEIIGGIVANSLALLADAGHMFSDVAALGLSLFALRVATRPPTSTQTYGYYRAEILAALANGSALVVLSIFIVLEAVERLAAPPAVDGPLMLAVACGGLSMNLVGLKILGHESGDSLNVRGAWLHVLSDALGSLGAIASALLVWIAGWRWADPAASVLIALFVVYSAWMLLKETVSVLMEAAPGHIDVDEVRDAMAALPGVLEVHDLHVWTITSGLESLSAHVVAEPGVGHQALLAELRDVLAHRFGIRHVTIQIEGAGFEEGEVCA
ncbi:MAG: cation transporter [Candidatus Dadabacteria bacterium]|nr:MAG: cation transporter [Candidatus Dadabacteria bacterium]